MDFVVLLGRILFGMLAIGSALGGHFANTEAGPLQITGSLFDL